MILPLPVRDHVDVAHPRQSIQRTERVGPDALHGGHERQIRDGRRRLPHRRGIIEHGQLRLRLRQGRQPLRQRVAVRTAFGSARCAGRKQRHQPCNKLVRTRPAETPPQRAQNVPLHSEDLVLIVQLLADGAAHERRIDLHPRPALERDDETGDEGQLELAATRQRGFGPPRAGAEEPIEVLDADAGGLAGDGAGTHYLVGPIQHGPAVGVGDGGVGLVEVVRRSWYLVGCLFLLLHELEVVDKVGLVSNRRFLGIVFGLLVAWRMHGGGSGR